MQVMTEAEMAEWFAASDEEWAKREAERKARERAALRAFSFEHAKFNLKRELYRKAINA